MKAIKLAWATALVLLTVTALAGPSSATAETTALCSYTPVLGEACEGTLVTHVHETTITGAKAKILSSTLNVECDVLFLGDALSLASPLVIHGAFTYTNCNSGCTITEEHGPAEIKVLKEGHETAKVTSEFLIYLNCGGFIKCDYNGSGLQGIAKGWWLSAGAYANGEVTIEEQTISKEGGFLCPSTAKLDIKTAWLNRLLIGT